MTSREHLGPGTGGRFSQVWLFWLLVVASVALVSGPRPPTQPRDRRDLERGRVTAVTANLRAQLLAAFQEWVMEEEPQAPPVAEIAQQKPIQLALLLEEYGRTLYEQGAPRRDYAETINILVQRFPFAKSFMAGPWKLLTTWETLWPGKIHPPMPLVLMKACVTTALTWGWKRMALSLLLGFYALLRCCEVIALKVSDCLMSSESGCKNVVFLRLTLVKSRTRGARMQSVRVDVPYVINFMQSCFKTMEPSERIWPHSSSLFRVRLQQLLKEVVNDAHVCVPSSLRPGGATHWFREWGEDLPRLQWRGRWLHFKTLAHYIQELGCVNVLESIPATYKLKMQRLADLCEPACQQMAPEVDLLTQVQVLVAKCHRVFPGDRKSVV